MIEELKELIESKTNKTFSNVTRDSLLTSDFGLNSFELFDLVADIEDKYDIEIPDRALSGFVTVGDVIDYIEENA